MAGRSELRRVAAQGYWREDEARVVVEAWRRSGESLAAFVRRQGIARRRLERWAHRLGAARGRVRFHRVRLVQRRVADTVPRDGAPIESAEPSPSADTRQPSKYSNKNELGGDQAVSTRRD